MNWLISANSTIYDHASAFQKWGFIDWRQGNKKYNIGDTIYIYCTRPLKRIMYKTIVEKVKMTSDEIVNDKPFWYDEKEYAGALNGLYSRLRLVEQVNRDELSLEFLLKNGLHAAPQGPIKLTPSLKSYIDKFLVDSYYENIYPDSAGTDTCIEGAKTTIQVNKYERSSVARQRCIDANGCYCHICGTDFQKVYGDIGKNFIHVHHKIPLNEISTEYIVDPINDLIPICPNCHAMLHRKINGKYLNIDELKDAIKK